MENQGSSKIFAMKKGSLFFCYQQSTVSVALSTITTAVVRICKTIPCNWIKKTDSKK